MVLFKIIQLPFRIMSWPIGLLAIAHTRQRFDFPPAGLDEARAELIMFALRRSASTAEEEITAERWLASLQIAQVAASRLLAEIKSVDEQLAFWSRRAERGGHFWFGLFRHGPVSFVQKLSYLIKHRSIVRDREISAAELVEKRVLFFRLIRSALCEALANVDMSVSHLHLQQNGEPIQLFEKAEQSINLCIQGITSAYDQLDVAAARALRDQGDVPTADGSHISRVAFLGEALTKVLRIPRIQSSRLEETDTTQTTTEMLASFQEAQRAVGFTALLPPHCTVREALLKATSVSQRLHAIPLIELPRWVCAPTMIERHWVACVIGGAIAGYGTLFLYRHSRLSGSRDLEVWTGQGAHAFQGVWKEHVLSPLNKVRGELFNTFRRRPSIVTITDYEAERDSLGRMLEEFKRDLKKPAVITSEREPSVQSGMDLLMRSYEDELRRPLKNLIGGDLARCLLIQVQKLKVDTQAAMLEIDQILRANELSISLVAAIPAFLIAGATLYVIGSWLTPAPPDPRREALPLRMAILDLERSLVSLCSKVAEQCQLEDKGDFIFRLGVAWDEAAQLFERHRGILRSADAEWGRLRADLIIIAAPGSLEMKARTAERMMRSYAVLQR